MTGRGLHLHEVREIPAGEGATCDRCEAKLTAKAYVVSHGTGAGRRYRLCARCAHHVRAGYGRRSFEEDC